MSKAVATMEDANGIPARRRVPGPWWFLAVLSLYAVAAAYVIDLARNRINPDAIAYIQNARHWLAGRADLAVNGWWGPLISWLLVPAVAIGGNPVVWFRAYNAVFGVVLAFGTMRLTGRLTAQSTATVPGAMPLRAVCGRAWLGPVPDHALPRGRVRAWHPTAPPCGRWRRTAFLAILLLSLGAVGDEITPDLLSAAALVWYFNASFSLLRSGGAKRAFAVGLLGGLCYLTKAYAVMFVAGHLVLTFIFRYVVSRKGLAPRGAFKPLLAAIAGLVLAALPWATAVSLSAGRPCISTIGCCIEAWGPLPTDKPIAIHPIQPTTPGRITNWENPVEIPYEWGRWKVTGPWDRLGKFALTSVLNAGAAVQYLFRFDLAGLLFAGWVVALAAFLWRRHRKADLVSVGRLWACLTVGFYISGFLPIWIVYRYLWPMWGLLVPIFASVLTMIGEQRGAADGDTAKAQAVGPGDNGSARPQADALSPASGRGWCERLPAKWRERLPRVLAGALLLSIFLNVVLYVFVNEQGPRARGAEATFLREVAEHSHIRGPIVARRLGKWQDDNWYRGLFTTFWAAGPQGDQAQFLGQTASTDANEIWAEVDRYTPMSVLVFDGNRIADGLVALEFSRDELVNSNEIGAYVSWHAHPFRRVEFVAGGAAPYPVIILHRDALTPITFGPRQAVP